MFVMNALQINTVCITIMQSSFDNLRISKEDKNESHLICVFRVV